ncbi:MAG: hypothetical protein A3J58_02595 [Candidatus Sungbacteria bacterium RIFCSPHIGHO2_02_FULL_52_23]|uniref:Sugar 3,4-ketoisomerase QdtA cupin domain-containing protein n=1 Tax=Candidatus Sungbacteria bacterium RIFCSPHIGHO2_02_FULL_52_23 TaxID=1802274 RepID=A0A1G2KTH0_9BACT|nr:MAG: hypothetical protein A3J58_02595 [Candidatus Sungbacteria bacterium RIFCSPHIGHO2_02_FULL_52_23]
MVEILVKNSGVVRLKAAGKAETGMLYAAEAEREIPFAIKRVYFMNGMPPDAVRGNHAHRTLTQIIFAAGGSFTLALDDGATKQTIKMSDPSCGIILGPHLWATMSEFSKDCVILIFADDYYDESEYIRDYAEFLEAIKQDTA